MRIWFALIIAPLLALTDQSISFAAVGWACGHQSPFAVHAVHLLFLVITAGATVAAWQAWRASLRAKSENEIIARRYFLSGLALASGVLSTLAIIAMWIPAWVIPPCSI